MCIQVSAPVVIPNKFVLKAPRTTSISDVSYTPECLQSTCFLLQLISLFFFHLELITAARQRNPPHLSRILVRITCEFPYLLHPVSCSIPATEAVSFMQSSRSVPSVVLSALQSDPPGFQESIRNFVYWLQQPPCVCQAAPHPMLMSLSLSCHS